MDPTLGIGEEGKEDGENVPFWPILFAGKVVPILLTIEGWKAVSN